MNILNPSQDAFDRSAMRLRYLAVVGEVIGCSNSRKHRAGGCPSKTAGGCPAASYFSCLAKKSNQKKSPPVCRPCGVPCVARLVRRLRNSRFALRQSSPTTPDQPPLLGGAQGKKKQKPKITRVGTMCPPYRTHSLWVLQELISCWISDSRFSSPIRRNLNNDK